MGPGDHPLPRLMSDTNGLFDPADPEYQFKVAEWFQKVSC